jgi:DNA-binding GntR family transcriptional regulator
MIRRSKFYNTSSDFVYIELRSKIVNKHLKPGQRLPEVKISNEMGVSRTPVREALRRLANEGLVRIIPNSGARVSAPTAAEVEGAYVVREHLEELSINLACKNGIDRRTMEKFEEIVRAEEEAFNARDIEANLEANNSFHMLIADASRNIVLREYVENIILRTNVYILFYDPFTEDVNYSAEEHKNIIKAIAERDTETAGKLMKEHLRHSHKLLKKPEERIASIKVKRGLQQ